MSTNFIAQAKDAGLVVVDQLAFGLDYAETLKRWRESFLQVREQMPALGFDLRFERTWLFYLAYCEAGFRAGNIDVRQIVYKKS